MDKLCFSIDEERYDDRHGHVLSLVGWYMHPEKKKCIFQLLGDGYEVIDIPEIERYERPDVAQSLDVETEGFLPGFTVTIPEVLELRRKYDLLELLLLDGEEKTLLWECAGDDLDELVNDKLVEFHIDRVEVLYGLMLEIQGWTTDQRGNVEVTVHKENTELLEQHFDYIFFTGSVAVGREVMAKASVHLTPVTLELGGKSPCVVDKSAKLDLAAKRLVFGKLLNCGQTCVAPDYVLIDKKIKDDFISALKKWMSAMYGTDPLDNQGYVRMINRKHFDRVMGLIDSGKVVYGGRGNAETLKIQPTILDHVSPEDPVMQEEIFGPVLPILTYDSLNEAVAFINGRPHPLALYLFSEDKAVQELFLRRVPFGGGCINDTIIHLASSRLSFGGVGDSGMGSYHGKKSFETFSRRKSIVKKSTWLDLPIRYAPYSPKQEKLLRFFLK